MAITVFPRNGKSRPSTSITVNTDALSGTASLGEKRIMMLGKANGGKPGQVYSISNYANAKDIFRGGDLLEAIEAAFNPTSEAISASTILALRVGNATQASLNEKGLSIKSLQYSADTNKIQVALRTNTLTKAKDLQVVYQPDKYDNTYASLGNIFKVSYDGSAQYTSVEVATDSKTHEATKLVLKAGNTSADAIEAASFDLGVGHYLQVANLVNDINAIAGFHADYSTSGNKTGVQTKFFDELKETQLDAEGVQITSVGGDIVNTLAYDEEIKVSYDPALGEPEDFQLTLLAGGTDGDTPTTWANEIAEFTNEAGYYLVPLTADATIHAEAVAFANDRTDNGDPTRVILGGGTKETVKQLTSRAGQLRDKRTILIGNSGKRLMNDGTIKSLPGYLVAAMVAGLASGLDIGDSVTFKTLDLVDLDTKFTSEELDLLDSQGVVPIEHVRNRSGQVFRVADDINTFPDQDDPVAGQMSAGEASDFLVTDMRDMLDTTFIGKRIGIGAAKEIKAAIISFLTTEVTRGTILDFDESDVSVVVQGNQANITITVAPMLVIKKIKVGIIYTNETLEA